MIHCTATPAGREVTGDDIRLWHTGPPPNRGWNRVGYSTLVRLDGTIEVLVPWDDDQYVEGWEVTYGARGWNAVSKHICYVGGKGGQDTRTEAQRMALAQLVLSALEKWPHIRVAGHGQIDPGKSCPSFDVPAWLRSIGVPNHNIW